MTHVYFRLTPCFCERTSKTHTQGIKLKWCIYGSKDLINKSQRTRPVRAIHRGGLLLYFVPITHKLHSYCTHQSVPWAFTITWIHVQEVVWAGLTWVACGQGAIGMCNGILIKRTDINQVKVVIERYRWDQKARIIEIDHLFRIKWYVRNFLWSCYDVGCSTRRPIGGLLLEFTVIKSACAVIVTSVTKTKP